jgi:hypothetical protein
MEIINYYLNIMQAMWPVATQFQPLDAAVRLWKAKMTHHMLTHVMLPRLNS